MGALYQKDAQKKPTNLSINSDLLAKSRKMQINLSALLEAALTEKLAQAENERWQAKNKCLFKKICGRFVVLEAPPERDIALFQ